MRVAFVFLIAVAVALAAPADKEPLKILRSSYEQDPAGPYQFGFETENKINREETGELREVKNEEGKPEQVIVVRGSYSYTAEDGTPITVTYFADETGFHAEGAHIPVAPKK